MVIIGQHVFPRSQFDVRMGKRLARARNAAKMTQGEVGERLGVRADTVSKWELGVRRPGVEILERAAKLYGVNGFL